MPLIQKSSKKALKKNIETEMEAHPEQAKRSQDLAIAYSAQRIAKKKGYASGGPIMPEQGPMSMAESIMKKRKMADGGMVDSDNMETPAKFSPYDDDNMEATMKELYDDGDDQLDDQPLDSIGDPGEDDEENQLDMISQIRRKMRK